VGVGGLASRKKAKINHSSFLSCLKWNRSQMGRSYYCDYCDRSFRDTLSARRRHLESGGHKALKATYYRDIGWSPSLLAHTHTPKGIT